MSDQAETTCSACGKRYAWRAPLAGKKVRCGCGQVFVMPAAPPGVGADDLMDLAPEAPASPIAPAVPAAAKVDRASLNDAIRTRMGTIPGKTGETRERERLEAARAAEAARTKPNVLRDLWAPIALIVLGIWLNFFQVSHAGQASVSSLRAIPLVMVRVFLAVALLSGGMVLARALLEVSFVHGLKQSMLRILAIAIGPSAIYALFATGSSDLAGPVMGTMLSLAAYSVLYWSLLQLDVRDTSICVMMTWILVAASNYAAFRAQGILVGSSI